ncbi:MAG: glycoside hydrolase family 88 protein, partial [Bacteroidota bacterium]
MKKIILISIFVLQLTLAFSQRRGINYGLISQNVATAVMNTWKDSFALDGKPAKWTYDMGVILKGFEGLWLNTGDVKYYDYIQRQMDVFVQNDGSIRTYRPDEYNIDHINNGKLLLLLYRVTLK